MPKWRKALKKFLERYINEPWFEGAILCGSYAAGNQDEFSDIDVTIVARNDIGWHEKGNCYVDGFLMEFTINPLYKLEEYMDGAIKRHCLVDQNQFAYGEVLVDKNGVIAQLRQKCITELAQPLEPVSDYDKNFEKYRIWCQYDELLSLQKAGLHIDMQYWLLVDKLITAYYIFHDLPHPPHSKIERVLFDEGFATRYHIGQQPPHEFRNLLKKCYEAKSRENKMKAVGTFYDYIINSAGGFDIGKFSTWREIPKK